MKVSMLLPLLLAGAFPACLAQSCGGDGGLACPARDPITPVHDGYDPSSVNWASLTADIVQIGRHEPRFCSFVIRAWFHDIAAFFNDEGALIFDGAADGSFMTDMDELDSSSGALHGFGQFTRHVLVQIAAAHGASHVDTLTVAAAKCTSEVLGGKVDIASHCEAAGLPLYVGKTDWTVLDNYRPWMYLFKNGNNLRSHDKMAKFVNLFEKMNAKIPENNWKIAIDEVMALMGSHTIMMTQACTTDGSGDNGSVGMDDRTCGGAGGKQRMFSWDNSFFKDVTAGTCIQFSDLLKDGDFSGGMNSQEHKDFTQCGFSSMEGFQLAEHLECTAAFGERRPNLLTTDLLSTDPRSDGKAIPSACCAVESPHSYSDRWGAMSSAVAELEARGDGSLERMEKFGPFNEGWRHIIWNSYRSSPKIPIEERAQCCGFQCQTCEDDPDSKFWCKDRIAEDKTTLFWPYTYMDCEFNKIIQMGGNGYCDGEAINPDGNKIFCDGCEAVCNIEWGEKVGRPVSELIEKLNGLQDAMMKFRSDGDAWEETYATAFCKLSNFGASFSGKVSIQQAFSGTSEPCLSVASVLSPKQCEVCNLDKFDTPLKTSSPPPPPPPPVTTPEEAPPPEEVPEVEEEAPPPEEEVVEEAPTPPSKLSQWLAIFV